MKEDIYFWYSLCPSYFLTCQVSVTTGSSGLYCFTLAMPFERWFAPFVQWFFCCYGRGKEEEKKSFMQCIKFAYFPSFVTDIPDRNRKAGRAWAEDAWREWAEIGGAEEAGGRWDASGQGGPEGRAEQDQGVPSQTGWVHLPAGKAAAGTEAADRQNHRRWNQVKVGAGFAGPVQCSIASCCVVFISVPVKDNDDVKGQIINWRIICAHLQTTMILWVRSAIKRILPFSFLLCIIPGQI